MSLQPSSDMEAFYAIEHELANRLRDAPTKEARRALYPVVYQERSERIADHPLVTRSKDTTAMEVAAAPQISLLATFVRETDSFCEIGAGDGAVAHGLAPRVDRAIAMDVTDALAIPDDPARGYEFRAFDGFDLGLANEMDVIYSNDVAEHLHPDDFADHAAAILGALVAGGIYVCVTPNRLSGPHDISRHFTSTPTGFHLREYTCRELAAKLRRAGFRRTQVVLSVNGRRLGPLLPIWPVAAAEAVIERLPQGLRRRLAPGLGAAKVVATK
jgi:SAM-dependent methyltransferase